MNRRQFFSMTAGFAAFLLSALPFTSRQTIALASFRLPPLPEMTKEWPGRLDLAYEVPAQIWRDFCALRDEWQGSIGCKGFHDDCTARIGKALASNDHAKALHWRAVQELAVRYAHIPTAAILVEDRLFREVIPSGAIYPGIDTRLRIVRIGAASQAV